jgi:hypothetical protein
VAWIFKEKYYPNGEFLQAKLGSRPSFAWRSIFNARGVLEAGLRWRVGNGEKIKIWGDKWLPPPSSSLFFSPYHGLDSSARVCDLIDPITRWWNLQLLHNIFTPEEVARICSVALSSRRANNTLIWIDTQTGIFSVKSAYHMEQQRKMQLRGESSRPQMESEVWKCLWQMRAPAKVKNLWWRRLGNNLLPTKDNLVKKKITTDPQCPFCLMEPETSYHILWGCSFAMAVWQKCSRTILKLAIGEMEGIDLMQFFWNKLNGADLLEALMVTREIWMRRNKFIFQDCFDPTSNVACLARKSVEDFLTAISLPLARFLTGRQGCNFWRKPVGGQTKINWDAAFDVSKGRMGMGVVIRDVVG